VRKNSEIADVKTGSFRKAKVTVTLKFTDFSTSYNEKQNDNRKLN